MLRGLSPLFLSAFALGACAGTQPAPPAPAKAAPTGTPPTLAVTEITPLALADTPNVHAFAGLLTSGQPTVAGLEAAAALGVRTVLNNRKDSELEKVPFDERAVVEGLGMSYVRIPWGGPEELTDEVLDRSLAFLREAERPALYHCASANRVGAAFAAWRALDHGVELEQALAEGRKIGLRTAALEPIVRGYVERRRAERGR